MLSTRTTHPALAALAARMAAALAQPRVSPSSEAPRPYRGLTWAASGGLCRAQTALLGANCPTCPLKGPDVAHLGLTGAPTEPKLGPNGRALPGPHLPTGPHLPHWAQLGPG